MIVKQRAFCSRELHPELLLRCYQCLVSMCGRYSSLVCAYVLVQVPLLKAIDERVHIWYCDRQGGTQSHGPNIINNQPRCFVLLTLQRLDTEGWRFAPNLRFDMNSHSPAQFEVTLHGPAVNLEAPIRQSTAIVEFTCDQVLRAHWSLVGRATTVYQWDLADHLPKERVVKLSWTEESRTPEPNVFKELGETPDEGVTDHILVLPASEMFMMTATCLIRKRLGTVPQPGFPEPRASRWLVISVPQKRRSVWGLTADELFNVWMQALSRMLDSSVGGCSLLTHFRSRHAMEKWFPSSRYQPGQYDVLPRRR